MVATVYGTKTGDIVAERRGDLQSLVDWFNSDFGPGYRCEICDYSGEVVRCLEF